MRTRDIVTVTKLDDNRCVVECRTDFGNVCVKRTFRKHDKKTRMEKEKGIYCFEIQGVFYWYTFDKNGVGTQYREPQDFRSEDRVTNKIVDRDDRREVKSQSVIELDIPKVNVKKEEQKKEENKLEEAVDEEVKHEQYETIKTCIENNIPVYLAGPAGSGKNHTLEQISWDLGMEFYFTNSVQQEFKLTGFIDAGGTYHETEFYKAFKNGGIFFLDEMDASIPEVLVLLNAAIANGYFEFPNGRINAHENFRVVAAGNTVGSGADEMYTGRLVLDQATLDRFAIIEFDYDMMVELRLSNGNKDLVDFIRDLREQAHRNGIRATFSYRCITMVTKLEKAGMNIESILKIAVFKGMQQDTINCFSVSGTTKYYNSLKELKRVAY